MRLDNKVATITGSGWGIGEAIARAFAREGARVVLSGRTTPAARLAALARETGRQGVEILDQKGDEGYGSIGG